MANRSISSSSSTKNVMYWYATSTSGLPPSRRCSSTVSCPPEKACLLILFLIWLGVSVMKMELVSLDALIFVWLPCRLGKNLEWMSDGLGYLSFTAASRVWRKYGSWSMAQGIRHGTSLREPKICGNELEKEGAAWIATKCSLPTLSLSTKPNVALDWLVVIVRAMRTTLW